MQGWWQLWVMLGLDPEPWQGWICSGGVCPGLELLCAAFKAGGCGVWVNQSSAGGAASL